MLCNTEYMLRLLLDDIKDVLQKEHASKRLTVESVLESVYHKEDDDAVDGTL